MARKNNKVVIEDVELKPQVIGHIYQKKTNIGRVLLIFVIFGLIVYYINDISVFFNNLIGKRSATSIKDIAEDDKKKSLIKDREEIDYYEISGSLVLVVDDLTITHFNYENNTLSFDIFNYTENDIDISSKNYYLQTYNSEKEVLDSKKLTIPVVQGKSKIDYSVELEKEFNYLNIVEK